MFRTLTTILTAGLLTAGLSAPASAAYISGTLGFNNGFDLLGNIVSDMTYFAIGAPTNASGGTGDFLGVSDIITTTNIDTLAPAGVIYSGAGFSFTLQNVSNISVRPLSCSGGICLDTKSFVLSGVVDATGFDQTAFRGLFTSNGSCLEEGSSGTCQIGTKTGSWSSSVAAVALPPVPIPAAAWLFGSALLGLGALKHKKA